jgi:outer membrane murein-binding lipoprotein Lpp
MSKNLFYTVIAGILAIILWSNVFSPVAKSQQVDFRVNNIESDMRRLEMRLNQIELLINKNTQIPPASRITQNPVKPQINQRNLSPSERDKMFDRLSTLVVELKQQVNDLTKRVVKLESGK